MVFRATPVIRMKTGANADDTGPRADNPDRTMLGATQLAWLEQTLLDAQHGPPTWKFINISDPIDEIGLDATDRMLLAAIIENYNGGPVGVETLAALTAEERGTIEDFYEPYLMQVGLLERTPRGRVPACRGCA